MSTQIYFLSKKQKTENYVNFCPIENPEKTVSRWRLSVFDIPEATQLFSYTAEFRTPLTLTPALVTQISTDVLKNKVKVSYPYNSI